MLSNEHRASITYVQAMCVMRGVFIYGEDTNPIPHKKHVDALLAKLKQAKKEISEEQGTYFASASRSPTRRVIRACDG